MVIFVIYKYWSEIFLNCEKCEHKEYCESEEDCLLDYQINKIKDKGRRSKQENKYYKSKKQVQLIYTEKKI
jgi:hypothetical protein